MAGDSGFKPQKEINRVKAQVRKLEREKDKSFPDLGKLAYQAYMEGRLSDPALVEACSRLKEIDTQVEQASAQIANLQAQAQQMKEIKGTGAPEPLAACPSCGAAVASGLKFCGNCGAALAQGPPATHAPPPAPPAPPPLETGAKEPQVKCPSCGAMIEEANALFCGECGAKVG